MSIQGETAAQTANIITVLHKSKDVIIYLCLINNTEVYCLLKSLVSFFLLLILPLSTTWAYFPSLK